MTTVFLRNGYLLWISVVVLIVAGLSALNSLPRLEDPRMSNRNPLVIARFPGASPERVESLITERLEVALQEIPEIKKVESTSRAGVAILAVELVAEIDDDSNDAVFSKIRDKLSAVSLPPGALPVEVDDQRGAVAFTHISALVWDFQAPPQLGILNRNAEELAERLRGLSGTELVRLYGQPREEVTVTVNSDELAILGLSTADVSRAIIAADAKTPAGQLRSGRSDLSIEVTGALDSLARIQAIPLREGESGTELRLTDIADVRRQWQQPATEIALSNGRRGVFIAARMKPGLRVDRWAAEAEQVAEEFRAGLGQGLQLVTVFDQSIYTNERLASLASNLFAGAVVIVLVILLFMGWRSALLVGSALPLVSGATLFVVLVSGGSLHQMSIFGMIIALGLLIDNAIVVVDEIRQARQQGAGAVEAVDDTIRHLFQPLLASTLTTVFAFAPIVLLPGNIGDFVGSIGSSVVIAVVGSFVVALTLIAGLAGRYDRAPTSGIHGRWWRDGLRLPHVAAWYERTIRAALRAPLVAAAVAIAPAILGFAVFGRLGNQFFPRVDRNMFRAQVWLPPESSVEHTRELAERLEAAMRKQGDIDQVHWLVGGSAPTVYYNLVMNKDAAANYAQAIVVTKSADVIKQRIGVLQAQLDREFPEAQIVVTQFAQGPPVDAPVQYRLYGPSISVLQDLGEQVRLELQAHAQVLHTQVTMPRGKPKLWVDVDENAARLAGLTLADVAAQLEGNLEGSVGGSILEGIEELPVRVRVPDDDRASVSSISSTTLVSPKSDRWVPLAALGELALRPEIGEIGRKDGFRTNTIRGYVTNEALPIDIATEVLNHLQASGFELPPGYRIELGGDAEEEGAAVAELQKYLPVLITLTIATLILVFRSVTLSLLLCSVAVFSIGLGVLSTWLFGYPFSFNTILGSLGLVGVSLNDSIVVLAAIRANPLARLGDLEEIVSEIIGCTRHVLSTTLTTSGGFVPLILAGGDFWPPLAVVIAGGVIGASLIALIYIPTAYVLLQRVNNAIVTRAQFVGVSEDADHGCVIATDGELDRRELAKTV